MELHHLEEAAAIAGHPKARYKSWVRRAEWENGRFERAVNHLVIAAKLGYADSIKPLKQLYAAGTSATRTL